MGNVKTSHNPYTRVNFHGVTLGGIIKDNFNQFDFGDTHNYSSNVDTTIKYNYNGGSVHYSMILIKLSKRENVPPSDITNVP